MYKNIPPPFRAAVAANAEAISIWYEILQVNKGIVARNKRHQDRLG